MKKSAVAILAFLYLTISSGMVLNIHYCMGKVSKVELDNFSKAVCKCGSGKKAMSCCKDEIKLVKLTDSHKATTATVNVNLPVVLLSSPLSFLQQPSANAPLYVGLEVDDPPIVTPTPVYIQHCVFRI